MEERILNRIEGLERVLSNEGCTERMELGILLLIHNSLAERVRALLSHSASGEPVKVLLIHNALAEQEKAPSIHILVYSVRVLVVCCREHWGSATGIEILICSPASEALHVSMPLHLPQSMLERAFEKVSIWVVVEVGCDLGYGWGFSWLV